MGTLTRKEQKERTRMGLLAKAERLFAANGIGVTATAEITASLGVSHGTLFLHFENRPALITAVVEDFVRRVTLALEARLMSEMPLKEVLRVHVSVLADFEEFYFRVISEPQHLPPTAHEKINGLQKLLSGVFYESAQAPMANGQLKKVGAEPFFQTWMALLHYQIMNRHLFTQKNSVLKTNGEMLLGYFLLLMKTDVAGAAKSPANPRLETDRSL